MYRGHTYAQRNTTTSWQSSPVSRMLTTWGRRLVVESCVLSASHSGCGEAHKSVHHGASEPLWGATSLLDAPTTAKVSGHPRAVMTSCPCPPGKYAAVTRGRCLEQTSASVNVSIGHRLVLRRICQKLRRCAVNAVARTLCVTWLPTRLQATRQPSGSGSVADQLPARYPRGVAAADAAAAAAGGWQEQEGGRVQAARQRADGEGAAGGYAGRSVRVLLRVRRGAVAPRQDLQHVA